MNNLTLRAISGVVYIALIVGAICLGSNYFYLLTSIFAILGILELQRVALPGDKGTVTVLARVLDAAMAAMLCYRWTAVPESIDFGIVVLGYLLLRGVLALYDHRERAFRAAAWSVTSLLYVALPLAALNHYLYADSQNISASGARIVLFMFVMIWLNDTGAYCVGSLCGRHKLFERLSPKKSWEGFFGGLAFCLLASVAVAMWLNPNGRSLLWWLAFGTVVCVFSTWGDLFESLLKRNAGVKDSGNIIPGHGGILDRIDSLLFVAPAIAIYISLASISF